MSEKLSKMLLGNIIDSAKEEIIKPKELPTAEETMNKLYGIEDTNKESEKVVMVKLSDIIDHPKHSFEVLYDEEFNFLNDSLNEFVDSIKEYGIMSPVLLTDTYGDYELNGKYICIAGHRRRYGAKLAGLKEIPAIIRSLSEEEADKQMVESNNQREVTLPSEKAKSYLIEYEALKRQGKRTDLELVPPGGTSYPKGKGIEIMAEAKGEGKTTIQNYLRLNHLIPQWLKYVDYTILNEKCPEAKMPCLGIKAGVNLSYLKPKDQETLFEVCMVRKVDQLPLELSEHFKEHRDSLDVTYIDKIIANYLENKKRKQDTELKFFQKSLMKKTNKFFPKSYDTPKSREDLILKALEEYYANHGIEK